MTPRTPPHDIDAEESLIGAMLLSRDAIESALANGVEGKDFYKPGHGDIYQAIVRLHAAGNPIDTVTVAGELNGAGARVGGRQALTKLQTSTPASANARAYARTVHEHAEERRILALLGEATQSIYDGTDPGPFLEELHAQGTTVAGASWAPVDLEPILDGDLAPPEPALFARDDGRHLLYAGLVHTFVGESESLKSWMALLACAQELTAGHHVVYLDFEDTAHSILGRLRSLGVQIGPLVDHFHYFRPDEPLTAGAINRLERMTTELAPTLAVVDGVTEAMAIEGLDLLDNTDVATWLARLPRRMADHGPAVVLIDHVPKSSENRGRYAIGAQHKLAGIYVSYVVEPIHPLAHVPEGALDPINGKSKITVAKDRPGAIRGFAANRKHVGTLELTAWPDGGITGHVVPATEMPEGGLRPTHVMERVSDALEKVGTPLTKKALRAAVKAKNEVKDLAIEILVAEGYIAIDHGPRNQQLHKHLRPYREKDDEELHQPDPQQPRLDQDDDF